MKKNLFLICALVLMTGFSLSAQNPIRCATMEYLAALNAADPGLKARMADIEKQTQQWIADHQSMRTSMVITIPVVFHVVYSSTSQNLSDAQCGYQLAQLNADYARLNSDAGNTPSVFTGVAANTQIQFCLAQRDPNGNATSGIIHKSTSTSSFSSNDNIKHNSTGGDDGWNSANYLNIWTGNLSGGLLGYATFPGGSSSTDGVVVLYSSVGSIAHPGTLSGYNLGRTATHEVGHWLNLRHINGDSNCGNDLVSDTPIQDQLHFGCPNHPYHTNACGSGTSPNGEMFMNYMDYTDDACMNMFSSGQATRMQSAMNTTRVSILSSNGCVPVNGCGSPSGLNATSITQTSATLNWTAGTGGPTSYNVQYRQTGTTTWITTTSATTSKAISGLSAGTQYNYQVQSVCTGGSSAYSSIANFTTLSANCSNNYEPNGTKATATPITLNTNVVSMITPGSDKDFFSFNNSASAPNIQVTLTNLPADYDMSLLKGSTLASSQNGGTSNETINYNTTVVGNYKVKVFGSGGANSSSQCYTLKVTTSSSAFVTPDDVENTNEARITSVLALYPNPVKDVLNVRFNSSIDGNITIKISDMIGKTVMNVHKQGTTGLNNFDLNMSDLYTGIYFVEVNNGIDKKIRKIVLNK